MMYYDVYNDNYLLLIIHLSLSFDHHIMLTLHYSIGHSENETKRKGVTAI
jgi:hypothetical protein